MDEKNLKNSKTSRRKRKINAATFCEDDILPFFLFSLS
jgi:hypothetical protein